MHVTLQSSQTEKVAQTLSGEIIFRTRDPHGDLRVIDDGVLRTLSFRPGNEQSACLKANPPLLMFEYTQMMMLALLFRQPQSVLCLGLGAGSLITTLHAHCPEMTFTAVELRQAVIDVAHTYFYLPRSERIRLYCQDAATFVATDPANYDVIFSDIYTAGGVAPVQLKQKFLRRTAARLSPEGLLVINCWHKHLRDLQLIRILQGLFSEIQLCPTGDGSWVIFASGAPLESRPQVLRAAADQWSGTLGFSLLRHLKQLHRVSHYF